MMVTGPCVCGVVKRLPIASSLGNARFANVSLTMATSGVFRSSRSVKSRPFSIGIRIVLK